MLQFVLFFRSIVKVLQDKPEFWLGFCSPEPGVAEESNHFLHSFPVQNAHNYSELVALLFTSKHHHLTMIEIPLFLHPEEKQLPVLLVIFSVESASDDTCFPAAIIAETTHIIFHSKHQPRVHHLHRAALQNMILNFLKGKHGIAGGSSWAAYRSAITTSLVILVLLEVHHLPTTIESTGVIHVLNQILSHKTSSTLHGYFASGTVKISPFLHLLIARAADNMPIRAAQYRELFWEPETHRALQRVLQQSSLLASFLLGSEEKSILAPNVLLKLY